VNFEPDCLPWIRDLVYKWRQKTPDVKQQADSISNAISKRFVKEQTHFRQVPGTGRTVS
jgi:hypothetical protein